MRYIDADGMAKRIDKLFELGDFDESTYELLMRMVDTAVDVPERKVGKWVVIMDEPTITFDECKCSECGVIEYFNKGWKKFNYCPNCGAEMRERGEDEEN